MENEKPKETQNTAIAPLTEEGTANSYQNRRHGWSKNRLPKIRSVIASRR